MFELFDPKMAFRIERGANLPHLVDQLEGVQKCIACNPRNLKPREYRLYQPKVAGTFQVPSAEPLSDI